MKLRYRFANQVVGVFVVLAIAATISLIILMGANQRWFRKNYTYYAEFSTATDLTVGMPITFRGFDIGKVTDVSLNDENTVDVTFTIQEEYVDKMYRDSLIQLLSSPISGGQIVLHQGREETAPIAEGSQVPVFDSKDGVRLREDNAVVIVRNTDPIAQALSQIDPLLLKVDEILTNVADTTDELNLALRGESSGPVSGVLNGLDESVLRLEETIAHVNTVIDQAAGEVAGILDQVDGVFAQVDGIAGQVDDVFGQVDGVVDDVDTILGQASNVVSNIEMTTESLRDPTGLVPRLLDPQGSIATILDDDNALFEQITDVIASLETSIAGLQQSIADIQQFTTYLNTTQPQISSLLEEGRQTLSTGQDVLEGLRNNPLLRGGIPEEQEQPTTSQSIRDEEF
jgi:phospholipid/cholesterol/gamma-HCH transport system substrate-binding protein